MSGDQVGALGRKQVFRQLDHGVLVSDTLGRAGERLSGEPLLVSVMRGGRRLPGSETSLREARTRVRARIESLPPAFRSLDGSGVPPVAISDEVNRELERLRDAHD